MERSRTKEVYVPISNTHELSEIYNAEHRFVERQQEISDCAPGPVGQGDCSHHLRRAGSGAEDTPLTKKEPMASESEQNFEQYLKGVEFPASKEEVISAAKSNDAPQHLVEHLEGLRDAAEFSTIDELSQAESYEEQATEQRES